MGLGDFTGPLICGVDEAGRGPLAGPVVAAAVILSKDIDTAGIDDSKNLTAARREFIRQRILESSSIWGIGVAGPERVDQINILQATFLAMRRAINNLGLTPRLVLVDGRLKIPDVDIRQKAIVNGDGKVVAIAAASILAKTYRDDIMKKLDRKYPGYGFSKHKGYPTKEHIANLADLGPCPVHRKSFRPVRTYFNN